MLTVRRFALVMQTEDERHQVPPSGLFGQLSFQRCIRHIFTTDEVLALIQAARQLPPAGTIRPATFSTMFGLLAATGLRSSEALALTFADITADGLIVNETKFRKSRLVPLHETTMHVLEQYLTHRKRCRTKSESVFVSQRGTSFSYVTVNHVFLALLRNLGFRKEPGHPGPCLHDLRHTFAVRSLEQCIGDSEAIKRHMVGLSTYLGHAHISDTYWYLQATPRLMSPNPSALIGIRDRAMLHLAFAAGLRVSELIGLDLDEIQIKPHPTIQVHGKGRRERVLPLWKETATALQSWLSVRFLSQSSRLFLNARSRPMTRSGFEYILAKHVEAACLKQPSLEKKQISPHVLRHSCAMHTLQATRDIRKVALWLGHTSLQSTEVYLRADPTEKLEALAGGASPHLNLVAFGNLMS